MWTDRELLAELKRGDSEAWDEAFRRLYPPAFAAARHPLASLTPTEAEDVAIEALTLLLPKVKQVDAFDELRLLVITIASRKAISEKRRQLADKRGGGDVTSLDAMQDDETIRFEPAEQLASHLTSTDLRDLAACSTRRWPRSNRARPTSSAIFSSTTCPTRNSPKNTGCPSAASASAWPAAWRKFAPNCRPCQNCRKNFLPICDK